MLITFTYSNYHMLFWLCTVAQISPQKLVLQTAIYWYFSCFCGLTEITWTIPAWSLLYGCSQMAAGAGVIRLSLMGNKAFSLACLVPHGNR